MGKTRLITAAGILACMFCAPLPAQTKILTGKAGYKDGETSGPLEYANVALFQEDSTFVAGTVSGQDGSFSLTVPGGVEEWNGLWLKISYIGYKPVTIPATGLAADTIWLQPDETMLREVTVEAKIPTMQMIGNTFKTQVSGSIFANLGTAGDVLSQLPFITRSDETFQVAGKGEPQIYINNRLVRDGTELQMLKSEDIKNVQLIMSPGAEYGSEVKAVVKIATRQNFSRGLSVKAAAALVAQRRLNKRGSIDLSYRTGNWELFGQGMFAGIKTKAFDDSRTSFSFDNTNYLLESHSTKETSAKRINAKGGFNYNHDALSFGAFYQYANSPVAFSNTGLENDYIGNSATENIERNIFLDQESEQHLVSVYYDNTFAEKYRLHFDGNFMQKQSADDNLTQTLYTDTASNEIVPSATTRESRLWAGKLYIAFPVGKGDLTVGTEDAILSTTKPITYKTPTFRISLRRKTKAANIHARRSRRMASAWENSPSPPDCGGKTCASTTT